MTLTTRAAQPLTFLPLAKTSTEDGLAAELTLMVLSYLHPKELCKVGQTCRYMCQLAHDDTLWKALFARRFPQTLPVANESFLEAYKRHHLYIPNQQNGVYASHTLHRHSNKSLLSRASSALDLRWGTHSPLSLVQDREMLCSGAWNGTIKVWNLKTRRCTSTFQAHDGPVHYLVLSDGMLYSASGTNDRIIKVWDPKTAICTGTFEGHTESIQCIAADQKRLYSSSYDKTIKIWDLKTRDCTATLRGHTHYVENLAIENKMLCSGSVDATIRVWNAETGDHIATLQGHTKNVSSLFLANGILYSGSFDETIRIWNLEKELCIAVLQGHTHNVNSLALDGDILYSGSWEGTVKAWDLKTKTCTATIKEHTGPIRALVLVKGTRTLLVAQGTLVADGLDETIKIWDFAAPDREIFQELAELITSSDPEIFTYAMDRFLKMPKQARDQIYREIGHILKPSLPGSPECAEQEFHDHRSTPLQKAQAIEKYLSKHTNHNMTCPIVNCTLL